MYSIAISKDMLSFGHTSWDCTGSMNWPANVGIGSANFFTIFVFLSPILIMKSHAAWAEGIYKDRTKKVVNNKEISFFTVIIYTSKSLKEAI